MGLVQKCKGPFINYVAREGGWGGGGIWRKIATVGYGGGVCGGGSDRIKYMNSILDSD